VELVEQKFFYICRSWNFVQDCPYNAFLMSRDAIEISLGTPKCILSTLLCLHTEIKNKELMYSSN